MNIDLLTDHHMVFLSIKEAAPAPLSLCQNATLLEITCHGSYILFQKNPITVVGGEVLLFPRSQICDPPDYWELFQNRRTESTAL